MNIYKEPKVTVISSPNFHEPKHLQVNWKPDSQYPTGLLQSNSAMLIEFAGRLCYMSQNNPANKTTSEYIHNILEQAHGSVLEHANISILIEQISRSCSHEIVRHRAGFAYSQLSQRYVDESDVGFVMPPAIQAMDLPNQERWIAEIKQARDNYAWNVIYLIGGDDPEHQVHTTTSQERRELRKKAREAARSVLPNATETKMVMTGNLRAWRHFLTMRGSKHADAEIRNLAIAIYRVIGPVCPEVFQDIMIYKEHKTDCYRKNDCECNIIEELQVEFNKV